MRHDSRFRFAQMGRRTRDRPFSIIPARVGKRKRFTCAYKAGGGKRTAGIILLDTGKFANGGRGKWVISFVLIIVRTKRTAGFADIQVGMILASTA